MNIQIYFQTKNFDVQKAERYFKERRIAYTLVDLSRHKLGLREIRLFAQQIGIRSLVDTEGKLYKTHYIRNLTGEGPIMDALVETPALMKTPIVRNGQRVTQGYCPDVWQTWQDEG